MSIKESLKKIDKKDFKELFSKNILSFLSGIFLIFIISISFYLVMFLIKSFTTIFYIDEVNNGSQVIKFNIDLYDSMEDKMSR
ncbi:MAG: hypothetical protein AAB614_02060 [Patescibacteria group bacterium]